MDIRRKRFTIEGAKRIILEKKRLEEKKRIAEEKKRIALIEKQRIAEEKKRIAEEKKRFALEEKKRIAEEKKRIAEEKKRIVEEKKRLALIEKQRIAEEKIASGRKIRKRISTNATKHEREFVKVINSMFVGPATFVFVDIKGNKSREIHNVVRFRQLQGSKAKSPTAYVDREYNKPKADIAAVDITGKDVAWISHKASEGYQQYLKISGKNLKFTGKELEEVLSFKRKVVSMAPVSKIWPANKTVWSPIKSNLIKNQAIFGFDYGKKPGRDNVDIIGQGRPIITKRGSILYLTFTGFSALNGHLENFTGKHEPVFYVRTERSSSGRSITTVVNGVTYKNLRFFIHPYNFVSSKTQRIM
ncbi:endonuclease [Paramecium bursaria Chlorella virus AN69C]|uniref:Type II restriction enzyme CviJI n=2 Tax=Paramecium bursaria Chlorella virus IL3A TaxID=46019 RepID=T2C1_PBCVI|nr:RecName: Full=Type II restriction enzyme CviJI; Short=R.CviJI; AltName: Full=Endonuclease CviJI; AltName: Full=Type-2 restriction enzyme CviJI [Paramecium bursaria Chlorella virus IL3A]AGE48660.1 endonuclease [Paramecium bursaria Chlorella virus AN69C]AGE54067.1 endonuclease [Paramecium bursaria Chlorella virus IL3A]AGE57496.1 endonuclease [Paramecium bursaria Chlorella virus NE-JV-4]